MEKTVLNRIDYLAVLLFLVYMVPDDVHRLLSIYTFTSKYDPSYIWLDWPVGVFYLLPMFSFIVFSGGTRISRRFLIVMAIILGFDIFKSLLGFTLTWEIYISILISYSSYLLIKGRHLDKFVYTFLFFNIVTVYISLLMGRKIVNINGAVLYNDRYNAIGLDIGFTGVLCLIFIMLLDIDGARGKTALLAITLGALLLTGSRLAILLVICYFLWKYSRLNRKFFINALVVFIIAVSLNSLKSFSLTDRFVELYSSLNGIDLSRMDSGAGSLLGRLHSFVIGLRLLIQNLYGVGLSIQNVQNGMNMLGYPTFSHSTVFVFLQMIGPLFLLIVGLYWKYIKRILVGKYGKLVAILILYNTVAGGAIINPKIFFIYFILFGYIKQSSNMTIESSQT